MPKARVLDPIVNSINYEVIDKRRIYLGLTKHLLAQRADIVPMRLGTMLRGLSPWRIGDLKKVLEILKLGAEDVISDKAILANYYDEQVNYANRKDD